MVHNHRHRAVPLLQKRRGRRRGLRLLWIRLFRTRDIFTNRGLQARGRCLVVATPSDIGAERPAKHDDEQVAHEHRHDRRNGSLPLPRTVAPHIAFLRWIIILYFLLLHVPLRHYYS